MKDIKEDRFIVSVKVGPKGQITIPAAARKMFNIKVSPSLILNIFLAAARKMFNIKEGDTLMVMGDKEKGIALIKDDVFYQLMGGVFNNDNSNKD